MAKKTTGDLLVERLEAWGVDTIFGLPGDGINGVMEALRKKKDKIRFVLVPHSPPAATPSSAASSASVWRPPVPAPSIC